MDFKKMFHTLFQTIPTIKRYRWLMLELIIRDIKLRYRGSALGFMWTFLNPLIFMAIYSLVFSVWLRLPIPNYPVFLICGLLPWMWFTQSIPMGTDVFLQQSGFLSNAVFPADILPWVSVANGLINFLLSLPILFGFFIFFGVPFRITILALPLVVFIQALFSVGLVTITATFNVFFRDVFFIVNHILQALFFVSPVMYDFSVVPPRFHWVLKMNPLTILFQSYRKIFLYGLWPDWYELSLVFVLSILVYMMGATVLERNREIIAEYL